MNKKERCSNCRHPFGGVCWNHDEFFGMCTKLIRTSWCKNWEAIPSLKKRRKPRREVIDE